MPELSAPAVKIIVPPGRPRLLRLDTIAREVVIQTPIANMVQVRRHWNADEHRRRLCECCPECATSALDTFASVLEWIGPLTYEQVVWSIPEACFRGLVREAIFRTTEAELSGLKFSLSRTGKGENSRIAYTFLGKGTCKSKGFDLNSAVQTITQISTNFFGQPPAEPEVRNADQTVNPIRARIGAMPRGESVSSNGKPRLPLGMPQKG